MKRLHRRAHFWLWVLLFPALIVLSAVAYQDITSPKDTVNQNLPKISVNNSFGDGS